MKRGYSLRQRLLLAGTLGVLLVSAVATWLLGSLFERATLNALDRRLADDLIAVLAHAETDAQGRLQMRESSDQRYARVFSGGYWQVLDAQAQPLLQSRSLWDQSLTVPATLESGQPQPFDLQGPMQQPLRGLAQQIRLPRTDAATIFVVASDRSHLQEDAAYFRNRTALALAVLTALWFAVLAAQVNFGLRPLERLGQIAARVRRGEDARFPEQGLLDEVAPLAGHLNELLDHHGRMVARARSSAEDLAHALKTPLAVLAAETEGDGRDWRQTVGEQTRRMRGSIDRYLAVGVAADPRQRTPVQPVVAALARVMQRVHAERALTFDLSGCGGEVFAGAGEDLEEMLGNLLDNAAKWAASRITVTTAHDDAGLHIVVADDGPGLPADALARVVERRVRLDERDSGSGLGLAIVSDIADSYAGRLQLANGGPGLRATLVLPSAP